MFVLAEDEYSKNMSRGKLKPEDEKCIQLNYLYLKENLEACHLLDFLYQNEVITLDDKSKIAKGRSKSERNEDLLMTLLDSGPGLAFNVFLQSLEKQYSHILQQLKRKADHDLALQNKDEEIEKIKNHLDSLSKEISEKDQEIKLLKETSSKEISEKDQEIQLLKDTILKKDQEMKELQLANEINYTVTTESLQKDSTRANSSKQNVVTMYGNIYIEYNNRLKNAIRETFVTFIVPRNVLHVFRKRILMRKEDIGVEVTADRNGTEEACEVLLECLSVYDGWFHCLLRCLRDKNVKLNHVADILEAIEADVSLDLYNKY